LQHPLFAPAPTGAQGQTLKLREDWVPAAAGTNGRNAEGGKERRWNRIGDFSKTKPPPGECWRNREFLHSRGFEQAREATMLKQVSRPRSSRRCANWQGASNGRESPRYRPENAFPRADSSGFLCPPSLEGVRSITGRPQGRLARMPPCLGRWLPLIPGGSKIGQASGDSR
jgi:hypothetical protein